MAYVAGMRADPAWQEARAISSSGAMCERGQPRHSEHIDAVWRRRGNPRRIKRPIAVCLDSQSEKSTLPEQGART